MQKRGKIIHCAKVVRIVIFSWPDVAKADAILSSKFRRTFQKFAFFPENEGLASDLISEWVSSSVNKDLAQKKAKKKQSLFYGAKHIDLPNFKGNQPRSQDSLKVLMYERKPCQIESPIRKRPKLDLEHTENTIDEHHICDLYRK